MDNTQDQLQKNTYQYPSSQNGESMSDSLERDEVFRVFDEITEDLEMTDMWYETRQLPEVHISTPHPVAIEILQIGNGVEESRTKHHESLVESAPRRMIGKIIMALFTKSPSQTFNPTIDMILEHESQLGAKIFPVDNDVTSVKFFFLSDQGVHKWYHKQESAINAKNFTNSYTITEFGIEKSSTYFDAALGRTVNVSVLVDESEARNLLVASQSYFTEVTGKVHVKKAAPRFRFGTKASHDLAA